MHTSYCITNMPDRYTFFLGFIDKSSVVRVAASIDSKEIGRFIVQYGVGPDGITCDPEVGQLAAYYIIQ